ncbi:hypothetical protein ACIG56_25830 [Nocardia fusca]|uniref:hypothetical protein n=1 Tax=Nocardia fusca TaxID=941183 RepID=UPI0037CACBF3
MAAETGTNAVPAQTRAFTAGTAIRFALLLAFVVVDSLSLLSAVTSQLRSQRSELVRALPARRRL